ncbi:MAG: hypothetical protein Q7J32_05065 [Sphingomonadaceae bacterium]|nr:hypothetical protein [Sphingomonadaceae bacterium]
MRKITTALIAASMLATVPTGASAYDKDDRKEYRKDARDDRKDYRHDVRDARKDHKQAQRADWRTYRSYDYNRPDPQYGNYYADRYYRDGSNYQPRQLAANERVYRGQNGQYYCRRADGTTGLIIGGLAGGALGNVLAPGGSKTLGTIIGAVAGGVGGRALDRNKVSCR